MNVPQKNGYYSSFTNSSASDFSDNFQRRHVKQVWRKKEFTNSCSPTSSFSNTKVRYDVRNNVAFSYNNRVPFSRNFPIKQFVDLRRDKFCYSNCGLHDFVNNSVFHDYNPYLYKKRPWISIAHKSSNPLGPKLSWVPKVI